MFPNKNPAPAGAVSPPNRQMLRRCAVLAALFGILLFVLLLARLFQLQIAPRHGAAAAQCADCRRQRQDLR